MLGETEILAFTLRVMQIFAFLDTNAKFSCWGSGPMQGQNARILVIVRDILEYRFNFKFILRHVDTLQPHILILGYILRVIFLLGISIYKYTPVNISSKILQISHQ